MGFVESLVSGLGLGEVNPLLLIASSVLATIFVFVLFTREKKDSKLPPMVPYWIPFLGSTLTFGKDPLAFLLEQQKKYGEVFTFVLLGRKLTYFLGPDANGAFINAKGSDVSAEEAYASLTVPVFGKGVIYDVPNHIMVEQKKMCKGALTHEAFETYVPLIEAECREYLKRWKNEGEVNILQAVSELTIMTASRTLLGKEVRSKLYEGVADLYHDLDKGFTPLNFLFPNLPLPSYKKRDEAHIKMRNIFMEIIRKRRETGDTDHQDLMQTLMDAKYKDGSKMSDQEVAHMMIAVLMAGQHTSSTTLSWMGFYMAAHPDVMKKVEAERKAIFPDSRFNYEGIRNLGYMDQVLKETLRLSPPLIQVMRKVIKEFEYNGMKIPVGHYICVSPTATHHLPECFSDPETFNPDRFSPGHEEEAKGGRFPYIAFGGGRHRCIGEQFAFVQIKTVWTTILDLFEITPGGPIPKPDYTSLVVLPSQPSTLRYKRKIPLSD